MSWKMQFGKNFDLDHSLQESVLVFLVADSEWLVAIGIWSW